MTGPGQLQPIPTPVDTIDGELQTCGSHGTPCIHQIFSKSMKQTQGQISDSWQQMVGEVRVKRVYNLC